MSLRFVLAVASFVLALSAVRAQDVDGFAARSFTGENGVTMPYRLFMPGAEARKKALPLVVYLHGSGGIGVEISSRSPAATPRARMCGRRRRRNAGTRPTCSHRSCRRASSGEHPARMRWRRTPRHSCS